MSLADTPASFMQSRQGCCVRFNKSPTKLSNLCHTTLSFAGIALKVVSGHRLECKLRQATELVARIAMTGQICVYPRMYPRVSKSIKQLMQQQELKHKVKGLSRQLEL